MTRPYTAFVARFVGFENVFAREELAAHSNEPFSRWLLERSGPAGVAFRASSVTMGEESESSGWPARVLRVAPGPDGFTLHARAEGLSVRMGWKPEETSRRSPTTITFDLDPMDVRPIAQTDSPEAAP